jgi:isopentenyl-diphosphate delta-isomerase
MGGGEDVAPRPGRQDRRLVDLTDTRGTSIGSDDVLRAHRGEGRLHRAFSIFVFDTRGRTLLQRRSPEKRTFGGLWSNACCSHPRPDADIHAEAERRLAEEMGFTVRLEEVGRFTYRAEDPGSGLVEHEYDHVLVGRFDGTPAPDPTEVSDWRWTTFADLRSELSRDPASFTPWLSPALETFGDSGEGSGHHVIG